MPSSLIYPPALHAASFYTCHHHSLLLSRHLIAPPPHSTTREHPPMFQSRSPNNPTTLLYWLSAVVSALRSGPPLCCGLQLHHGPFLSNKSHTHIQGAPRQMHDKNISSSPPSHRFTLQLLITPCRPSIPSSLPVQQQCHWFTASQLQ